LYSPVMKTKPSAPRIWPRVFPAPPAPRLWDAPCTSGPASAGRPPCVDQLDIVATAAQSFDDELRETDAHTVGAIRAVKTQNAIAHDIMLSRPGGPGDHASTRPCFTLIPAVGSIGETVQALFLYALALGAGVCVAVQQVLNGGLRTALGSPAWAAFVSYVGGLLTMIVVLLVLGEHLPPWKRWRIRRGGRGRAGTGRHFHPADDPAAALAWGGHPHCPGGGRPDGRRDHAGSFRRIRPRAASISISRLLGAALLIAASS